MIQETGYIGAYFAFLERESMGDWVIVSLSASGNFKSYGTHQIKTNDTTILFLLHFILLILFTNNISILQQKILNNDNLVEKI